MAGLYPPEPIPESLDEDILQIINNLVEYGGLKELKENNTELRNYIKVPRSEQNRERALKEMKEDGLIE